MKSKSSIPASKSGKYWLVKSEPEVFSIDCLAASPAKTTCWEGVRNYQARNFMRDEMQIGDFVLFYHSNASPPAIVGLAKVVRAFYPDPTAFNKKSPYFDPKSRKEQPTWGMVDIQLVEKFSQPLGLDFLKKVPELSKMTLLQKGSRLSVQPVRPDEFDTVIRLSRQLAKPVAVF
jgi:predicted RNA-binding protein with PUA-like domain